MPVRLLFDSGQQYSGRAFRDCTHEAATHGVAIVRPQRGFRWSDDGVTLDILAPSLPALADTPQTAIISVGRHNAFGHPGPTTLATLERAGSTIYRTDRCGALTIRPLHPLIVIPSLSKDSISRGACGNPSPSSG
jgi:hypothetical protein